MDLVEKTMGVMAFTMSLCLFMMFVFMVMVFVSVVFGDGSICRNLGIGL